MELVFDSKKALEKLEKRLKADVTPINTVSIKAQVEATKLIVEKVIEPLKSRLDTIEIKTLIPIERGEQGRDGKDGRNGRDGANGLNGLDGAMGPQGPAGKDGKAGKHGVSVIDAEIAADDHLVLTLSDGAIIDAGELPTRDGQHVISTSSGARQITVSATAPSGPSVNDLWYDIS